MTYGFTEIDHLLAAADDPQAGGERYERLGFTVTPLSVIEKLGIANRLILMQPLTAATANFFECMGVVDKQRADSMMARVLSGPEGGRSMVLSGPDALASHAQLITDGFAFQRPLHLKRDWRLPSGEVLSPEFTVTQPIDAPLRFNFCQYHNLHCYLREQWLRHDNGAQAMTRVFAVSDVPREVASYFATVFGKPWKLDGAAYSVGPGIVQLTVGSPTDLRELLPAQWCKRAGAPTQYIGFEIRVSALSKIRSLLAARGVEFVELGRALVVSPTEACGNAVRFIE